MLLPAVGVVGGWLAGTKGVEPQFLQRKSHMHTFYPPPPTTPTPPTPQTAPPPPKTTPQDAAEEWISAHDPTAFVIHELSSEWKDRPVSDAQMAFCLRHGLPYDPAWTKGQARRAMDRYIVQVGVCAPCRVVLG